MRQVMTVAVQADVTAPEVGLVEVNYLFVLVPFAPLRVAVIEADGGSAVVVPDEHLDFLVIKVLVVEVTDHVTDLDLAPLIAGLDRVDEVIPVPRGHGRAHDRRLQHDRTLCLS